MYMKYTHIFAYIYIYIYNAVEGGVGERERGEREITS